MSIWLPRFRWDMLDATTGCHSKSGTPCKDMIVINEESTVVWCTELRFVATVTTRVRRVGVFYFGTGRVG